VRNMEDRSESFTVVSGVEPEAQAYLNAGQRGGTGPNGKPSKTIDQAGLHLIGGEPGWSAALGVAYTVSYAFRSTAPAAMPSDTGGFSRFNAAQIAQAELALKGWSDVANITFVRVGTGTGVGAYSNDASILLANYATGQAGAAAFASYPGDPSPASASGDVWVNSALSYNSNPVQGNYGGLVLVHELGHAIGLAHPGDYNAGDGVEITYANNAEYYEDSLQYTVMSYFDETDTGALFKGAYSAAPLLDDISAAQKEYGVNLATRTGDTVYGFNATADRPWFLAASANAKLIFAAWDAGGTDTFDFSGFTGPQTIDLREGYFSDVGGLVGNVAVAKGAAIENAVGGSGADTITGNDLANTLVGGAGVDILYGLAGDDLLQGGAGSNQLYGAEGQDWLIAVEGLDVLNGGGGHDTLWSGAGNDFIDGGAGDDVIDGGAGVDTITYASAGAGVEIDLRIIEEQLTRGGGVDTLISIEDVIGSNHDDALAGGAGPNALTGGAGTDRFLFYPGGGADRVTDFGASGLRELLDLAGYAGTGVTWSITQVAADTVVSFTNGDSITLAGFDQAHLSSGDFLLMAV